MTTTDNSGLAEQLAAVLAGHVPTASTGMRNFGAGGGANIRTCKCGHEFAVTYEAMDQAGDVTGNVLMDDEVAAHQAAQLVPLIEAREQGAGRAGWEKGYDAACADMATMAVDETPNPYPRADQ